jgi:hypothetical protein
MPQRRSLDHGDSSRSLVAIVSSMPMAWRWPMCDRQLPNTTALSDKRPTDDEAQRLARLIVRLPELIEPERERKKAKSRRRSPPPSRPVTVGDLARDGKLLEVECSTCKPPRHLYIEPLSLGLPKRMPVPEVADHLVCSVCGARNSETYDPIWARPAARVGGVGHYPDYSKDKL